MYTRVQRPYNFFKHDTELSTDGVLSDILDMERNFDVKTWVFSDILVKISKLPLDFVNRKRYSSQLYTP